MTCFQVLLSFSTCAPTRRRRSSSTPRGCWRGKAWQVLITTSYEATQLKKRGLKLCIELSMTWLPISVRPCGAGSRGAAVRHRRRRRRRRHAAAPGYRLTYDALHVIDRHLTQETMAPSALDDVASMTCQALLPGPRALLWRATFGRQSEEAVFRACHRRGRRHLSPRQVTCQPWQLWQPW